MLATLTVSALRTTRRAAAGLATTAAPPAAAAVSFSASRRVSRRDQTSFPGPRRSSLTSRSSLLRSEGIPTLDEAAIGLGQVDERHVQPLGLLDERGEQPPGGEDVPEAADLDWAMGVADGHLQRDRRGAAGPRELRGGRVGGDVAAVALDLVRDPVFLGEL